MSGRGLKFYTQFKVIIDFLTVSNNFFFSKNSTFELRHSNLDMESFIKYLCAYKSNNRLHFF